MSSLTEVSARICSQQKVGVHNLRSSKVLSSIFFYIFPYFPCHADVSTVIDEIYRLLKEPNADSPLEPEIAQQYKTDRTAWAKTAKEWTKKHAKWWDSNVV